MKDPTELDFREYSARRLDLQFQGEPGLMYWALKLNGEAGEVAEKAGKVVRDKDGVFDDHDSLALLYELGDVLWYVDATATTLGADLITVADMNLTKLYGRKARGTQHGSGDDR